MVPTVGIIGGSGVYNMPQLANQQIISVTTKHGKPSDEICLGEYCGRVIAFLPRHGKNHTIPPHRIPYRANLAALADLGIRHVLGTCVCGSLKQQIVPGTFVIPDQFVDLTSGREVEDEFNSSFAHLPLGEPYCARMRSELVQVLEQEGERCQSGGTVVVIQGPRFSTRAEIQWYAAQGWDIVNMTQYPECYFARELGMCYNVLASVTDFAIGVSSALNLGGRESWGLSTGCFGKMPQSRNEWRQHGQPRQCSKPADVQ